MQHRERGAIERVVVARINMTEVFNVRWNGFVLPAIAAEKKGLLRQQRRRTQEEFFDARLAIGQPIPKEAEVRLEPRIASDPVVCGWIQGIVNRDALSRPGCDVGFDDWGAAAVSEHHIVPRNELPKRIG